jgi:hypothetical protein
MAILGYSERGIFTSIVYYLDAHKDKTCGFLKQLGINLDADFKDFTFLIEASFSNFGEPDLTVIAKKATEEKVVIFIEGKTIHNDDPYSVRRAFQTLKDAINAYSINSKTKEDSRKKTGSNLFRQLYFKYELLNFLKNPNSAKEISLVFKKPNGTPPTTGTKPVVLRTCNLITGTQRYYYAAVLPSERITSEEFAGFFRDLGDPGINRFFSANKKSIVCGYWEDIENYFIEIKAQTVIDNFKHNEGQIYKKVV